AQDVAEILRVSQMDLVLDAHKFDLQEVPQRSSHQLEDQEKREDPVGDGAPAASGGVANFSSVTCWNVSVVGVCIEPSSSTPNVERKATAMEGLRQGVPDVPNDREICLLHSIAEFGSVFGGPFRESQARPLQNLLHGF